MLQHNLLVFFRNIKRNPSFFLINLIGLSVGLACTFLIYIWVNDELSVDKFHENGDRLCLAMLTIDNSGTIVTQEFVPGPLADALRDEIPEVEYSIQYTHTFMSSKTMLSVGDKNLKALGDYVSKDFFNVFSFNLLQGNKDRVLEEKNSIVISEDLALKLFNTTNDVVGKSIEVDLDENFLVTGVFENVPEKSSEKFDFLIPFERFKEDNQWLDAWGSNAPGTAVVLKEGTNLQALNDKVANFVKGKNQDLNNFTLFFKPYSENYLYGSYENGKQSGGRIEYVQLFSLIAFFILLIACINFMNLSTAKSSSRMKEIGIKKAAGANRKSLILQYLGESLLMTFLALIVAVLIVIFALPTFNEITGKTLSPGFDIPLILSILGITMFTGLLAGSYPAMYLSTLKPAVILKGKLIGSASEFLIRKGLVIFQFALAVVLIVCVMVIYKQIDFIQSKNLGYDKDNIIYFDKEGRVNEGLETFLSLQEDVPGVLNASSMRGNFINSKETTNQISWLNKKPEDLVVFIFQRVNYNLFPTLGIQMAEGRDFSKEFSLEAEFSKIIFNETAIKAIGYEDPIGQNVTWGGDELEIIGVAKDFQFESLREKVKPMAFILSPDESDNIMLKLEAGSERQVISKLEGIYKDYNPGYPFNPQFLDGDYQMIYSSERRISVLSRYFAGLAIIISCLGLFGLATFTVERKTKEIGIRKALSASKLSIVFLLSKDFTKIVLIAVAIALPISYILSKGWLDNFVYRIDLKLWYFIAAGSIVLLVAWLTVGIQGVQAAYKNPVECLKSNE